MLSSELTNINTSKENYELASPKPLRILHVVSGMVRAGTETWLMQILRNIDRERFQMDFLVHTNQPCAYDEEIYALGSRIIPCVKPSLSKPWVYGSYFKQILQTHEPYDIIHSHVHYFSGYVLRLAREIGIPVRIAHSHNNQSALETQAGWLRRLYLDLTRRWIANYATQGLACSRAASADLFSIHWQSDQRWQLLYYGIDLKPFEITIDKAAIRAELGIPPEALVIGHVGRFAEQKNHQFLVDIFSEVVNREPNSLLLLIGEGELRSQIEQKITQLGLMERVIFTGSRPDVPQLMKGAMDLFLFPSLHEGLGLVLIEAQAAGLPCIFSDVVPAEADVVKGLVQRLSLSQTPNNWAEIILAKKNLVTIANDFAALKQVNNSLFNLSKSVNKLEAIYAA